MKLKMFSYEARDKMHSYAQSLPAGTERAKAYDIASGLLRCGANGVAYYVANLHRNEDAIRHAIYTCVSADIARENETDKVEFYDGSLWEPSGCTPAY